MYNRLDSIPTCDRQTDGQTSCHGIVRAMHMRRAVKMDKPLSMLDYHTIRKLLIHLYYSLTRIHLNYISCMNATEQYHKKTGSKF